MSTYGKSCRAVVAAAGVALAGIALAGLAGGSLACRAADGGGEGPDGGGTIADGGPRPMGTVGPTGGNVDRLYFFVFGDVRPPDLNQDAQYPTAILSSIMTKANSLGVEFGVGTGDYMFANRSSSVTVQTTALLNAEKAFTRPIFHVMGNHECNGFTVSNCPNGTETPNVIAYLTQIVPFATLPYYSFDVMTGAGVAKFVFVADNAWSPAQKTWLEEQLAVPTPYTFVVRHESPVDDKGPGTTESDAVIAAHPSTLQLYGHTHTYRHVTPNSVISGNAGAMPLSAGTFGFLVVEQRVDGNIEVKEVQYDTAQVLDHWVVTPTGTLTQ